MTAPGMATAMPAPTRIAMDEASAQWLVRLMALLSPAFPVGAFSYSHGLERAVHDGLVRGRADLGEWLADLLTLGSGWNDALLLAAAWRADERELEHLAEFSEALAGSAERHLETTAQGVAFARAARAWPEAVPAVLAGGGPYPVVVGAVARRLGLPLGATLPAWLHAFVSNLVQAAVRLVPLGQSDGVAAIAGLEPTVLSVARRAAAASLEDLGSAAVISDLVSMTHETQRTRLFRS